MTLDSSVSTNAHREIEINNDHGFAAYQTNEFERATISRCTLHSSRSSLAHCSVAQRLEAAIRRIEPGRGSVHLDSHNVIHSGGAPTLGSSPAIVSFFRITPTTYLVREGTPNIVKVFCGIGTSVPRNGDRVVIEKSQRLSTPGWISVDGIDVPLPGTRTENSFYHRWEEQLSNALPGDVLVIGMPRARVTVTVEAVERREDGSCSMTVDLYPGVRGNQAIEVIFRSGKRTRLDGVKTLASGTKLNLGDAVGVVTLPFPELWSPNLESHQQGDTSNSRP